VKSLLPNRHRIWLASISPFGAKLRLQVPEGRNVIAFAPDQQCVGATGVSTPSSCRTRCRTRRGLAPCGKRDGGIGRIAARMSKSSAPTSFRPRSPGSGISATIPIRSSTIPMPGPTSRPSSATEDLFYDYRTNVAAYPTWQAYLREQPPPLLVLGGEYDPSFTVEGRWLTDRMSRARKSMSSRQATSPWIRRATRCQPLH